jgi:hypothetical protein
MRETGRRELPSGGSSPLRCQFGISKPEKKSIHFQVANTWTKITARYGYAMVRNGKELENPLNLLVAATLEKAITYVFAGSPIRNAEARSSTLLCSTNNPKRNQIVTVGVHELGGPC